MAGIHRSGGVVLLALCLFAAGCATVVRGPNEVLRVESFPSGARVQLSNGMTCAATPCDFRVSRNQNLTATVTRAGCQPGHVNITSRVARRGAAATAGNVVTGGFIGVAVDGATGALHELTPNPAQVRLRCTLF